MVFYVVMEKFKEYNGIIYYHVTDYLGKKEFYIGVDSVKRQLFYFELPNFDNPLKIIDFSDPKKPMESMPGIARDVSNWIIANMFKAVEKGVFPNCIQRTS